MPRRHGRPINYRSSSRNFATGNFARFITHIPFDIAMCEPAFPVVIKDNSEDAEKMFQNALEQRNEELTPSAAEQAALSNLLNKVNSVLENLLVSLTHLDLYELEEFRLVGACKKGIMIAGNNVAEIVVVLKQLPTKNIIELMGNRVWETLKMKDATDVLTMVANERGFDLSSPEATVKILVTVSSFNLRKVDGSKSHLRLAHSEIQKARWFEENAQSYPTLKSLIRLLLDLRKRFSGLQPLTNWMIDLVAHYVLLNNPSRKPLPLHKAYKRFFQIISAGFFLPGSAGITEMNSGFRIHTTLTLCEQDLVCLTCQTLLRFLSLGGYKKVIGIEGNSSFATETSVCEGVTVSPLERVYEENVPKNEKINKRILEEIDTIMAESNPGGEDRIKLSEQPVK